MSNRTLLSRPRTRIYDANYNIGENYYRPALDRLDRKYSGRPLSPPRPITIPQEIADRHASAFADEDLGTSRRRAEKHIRENHLFDSRGGRIAQRALEALENDIDEETASSLKRIRANKKISLIDDVDLESTSNNIKSYRMLDRSEKILDTVGINSSMRDIDEDITVKRRAVKAAYDVEADDLTKWSPIVREDGTETSAAIRARQSRERIQDIEDEMNALSEKQAARERRVARLKALVAENEDQAESTQAVKSVSISARKEKKSVRF